MNAADDRIEAVVCRLSAEAANELAEIEAESNSPPWSAGLFGSEFNHAHSITYGIRSKGMIVGFVVAHVILDEAHVMNVGVRRQFRRQGFGIALMRHLLDELHARVVKHVTLEVRRGNEAAQAMYERLGFREVGVRSGYYSDNQEDALVMSADMDQYTYEQQKGLMCAR